MVDESNSKMTTGGIVVAVLVCAILGVDYVVLKGDTVASGSVSLRTLDERPLVISISQPHEEHLFEITTRRRENNETVGQSISYRLVDASGKTVAEDSEIFSRQTRFFEFVPLEAGEYTLYAEETTLMGSGYGTAYVDVMVGDRRVLSRLLGF